jgi:hypothetical protein
VSNLISEHGLGQGGLSSAPVKAAPAKTVTVKAPPLTLAQQAARLSNQTVATQVAAIRQQQQLELQQAQAQATQINAASQAAAQFMSGLGTPTYDTYKDAASTLAGLSGGFSGQLQSDASGEANKVLSDLKAVGGSAGQLNNTAPALANVLYGTHGYQPAQVLLNSGAAAAERENAIPQSLLGYGQNLAAGALATGRTNANSLVAQILDAQSKGPSLTSQYLSQLDTQQTNAEKLALTQALDQSLIKSRQNSTALGAGRLKVDQQNANTAVSRASNTAQADAIRAQIAEYNAQTGRLRATRAGKPSATTLKGWATAADNFYHGVAPKQHWDAAKGSYVAIPGTGRSQVNWNAAVAGMIALGATRKQAISQLNAVGWKPGEGGRPLTAAQIAANRRAAKAGNAMTPAGQLGSVFGGG